MNSLRNRVQLIGHLGTDPEVKQLESGKVVANFRIATSDNYRDSNGNKVEDTQWHALVAWGKTAEIAEKFLNKGKEIAVEGRLVHRSFDDKEGKRRYVSEVVVNEIVMVGKKPS